MKTNRNALDLNYVLPFGKHKGKTIRQVIDQQPSYIDWCLDNVKDFKLNGYAKTYLNHNEENSHYSGLAEDLGDIWADMNGGDFGNND